MTKAKKKPANKKTAAQKPASVNTPADNEGRPYDPAHSPEGDSSMRAFDDPAGHEQAKENSLAKVINDTIKECEQIQREIDERRGDYREILQTAADRGADKKAIRRILKERAEMRRLEDAAALAKAQDAEQDYINTANQIGHQFTLPI